MKIIVEMTAEEFQEFCEYRKNKSMFSARVDHLSGKVQMLANKIGYAVAPDPKKPGKYKIVDQDHLDDIYLLTEDIRN